MNEKGLTVFIDVQLVLFAFHNASSLEVHCTHLSAFKYVILEMS